jgi:membrane-bound lytic murein transglycosylase B
MGLPQFMPAARGATRSTSTRTARSTCGAARSTRSAASANYFKQHGWRKGAGLLPARVSGDAWRRWRRRLRAKVPVAKWLEAGVQVDKPDSRLPRLLVELDASGFRLGFRNFYVITRYNRSAMYAAAVHDLSQALRAGAQERRSPPRTQSEGK